MNKNMPFYEYVDAIHISLFYWTFYKNVSFYGFLITVAFNYFTGIWIRKRHGKNT